MGSPISIVQQGLDIDIETWERKKFTSTLSSSVTSTPESRPRPAISSTNAVASTSERLKSSKRKPKKWAKAHSSTRGFWTSSRPNANVASPSTLRSHRLQVPRAPRKDRQTIWQEDGRLPQESQVR